MKFRFMNSCSVNSTANKMELNQTWMCCTCSQTNLDPKRRRLVDAGARGGGFRKTLVELFAFTPDPLLPYVCHICVTSMERVITLQLAIEKKVSERRRRISEFDRMLSAAFPAIARIQTRTVELGTDSCTVCEGCRSVKVENAKEDVTVYTASVATQTDGVVIVLCTDGHSSTDMQRTSTPVPFTGSDIMLAPVPCTNTTENVQNTSKTVPDNDHDAGVQHTPVPVPCANTDCDMGVQHVPAVLPLTDIKINVPQNLAPIQPTSCIQSTRLIRPAVQNTTVKVPATVTVLSTTSLTTLSQPMSWSTPIKPPVSPVSLVNLNQNVTGIQFTDLSSAPTSSLQTILSQWSVPMQPVNLVQQNLAEATIQPKSKTQAQPVMHPIQRKGMIMQLPKESGPVNKKITSQSLQKLHVLQKDGNSEGICPSATCGTTSSSPGKEESSRKAGLSVSRPQCSATVKTECDASEEGKLLDSLPTQFPRPNVRNKREEKSSENGRPQLSAVAQQTVPTPAESKGGDLDSLENTEPLDPQRRMRDCKLFQCSMCLMAFERISQLKRHRTKFKHRKSLQCGKCSKVFKDAMPLQEHVRRHTGERPHVCTQCPATFSTYSGLRCHKIRHSNCFEKSHTCGECHKRFASQFTLRYHVRFVHKKERSFVCDECPRKFSTKVCLQGHKRTHTGEKPYKCDFCPLAFAHHFTLSEHRRLHTGEKPYKCDICSTAFYRLSCMRRHVKRCHFENYRCSECTLGFETKAGLSHHLYKKHKQQGKGKRNKANAVADGRRQKGARQHKPSKEKEISFKKNSYSCSLCSAAYPCRKALATHRKQDHGEAPEKFQCEYCAKLISSRRSLVLHLRRHTQSPAYSCTTCSASFYYSSQLTTHQARHRGEKRYLCELCSASFYHKSDLKVHMVIHSDERPFVCEACPAAFKRQQDLRRHRRLHTGWTYKCKQCPAEFQVYNQLQVHRKSHSDTN